MIILDHTAQLLRIKNDLNVISRQYFHIDRLRSRGINSQRFAMLAIAASVYVLLFVDAVLFDLCVTAVAFLGLVYDFYAHTSLENLIDIVDQKVDDINNELRVKDKFIQRAEKLLGIR